MLQFRNPAPYEKVSEFVVFFTKEKTQIER